MHNASPLTMMHAYNKLCIQAHKPGAGVKINVYVLHSVQQALLNHKLTVQ